MRRLEVCMNAQSDIGLEPKSHCDVVSYPYPSRLRELDESRASQAVASSQQLKLQVENWEDEGGQVAKNKKPSQRTPTSSLKHGIG